MKRVRLMYATVRGGTVYNWKSNIKWNVNEAIYIQQSTPLIIRVVNGVYETIIIH